MAKDPGLIHLTHSFYVRSTLEVAGNLLGKYLVRQQGRKRWIGRIVEVEAYIGEEDLWTALESLLGIIRKCLTAAGRRMKE